MLCAFGFGAGAAGIAGVGDGDFDLATFWSLYTPELELKVPRYKRVPTGSPP